MLTRSRTPVLPLGNALTNGRRVRDTLKTAVFTQPQIDMTVADLQSLVRVLWALGPRRAVGRR